MRPTVGGPPRSEGSHGRQMVVGTMRGLLLAIGGVACNKGPMQRTGEKIDRVTGQDTMIGTGHIEQASRNVDQAVKDLQK
jgi:hypothetical protein